MGFQVNYRGLNVECDTVLDLDALLTQTTGVLSGERCRVNPYCSRPATIGPG